MWTMFSEVNVVNLVRLVRAVGPSGRLLSWVVVISIDTNKFLR